MAGKLRALGLVFAFVLVVTACGGGDDTSSEEPEAGVTTTTAATTSAPTESQAPTTTAAPAESQAPATTAPAGTDAPEEPTGDGSALAANMAVVTIGDQTYEFDAEQSIVGRCDPDFFGAFWVIAGMADGSPGGLEMLIVPEGTSHDETSKVKVNLKDSEERDWRADEDGGEGTPEGQSRVESFTIDGNTVSGTASFVDIYKGDDATAEGTFTATCP